LTPNERHLKRVLDRDLEHDNGHRPHRSGELRPPTPRPKTSSRASPTTNLSIRRRQILGGLINEYGRAA
jgi:putative transposase